MMVDDVCLAQSRGRRRRFAVLFANVSSWSAQARSFFAAESPDVALAVETNLAGVQYGAECRRLKAAKYYVTGAAARPNPFSVPGRRAGDSGADPGRSTTGGLLLIAQPYLEVAGLHLVDNGKDLLQLSGPRHTFALWRLSGISFLVGAVYLRPGAESEQDSLMALAEAAAVVRKTGLPFVLAGDFNRRPEAFMRLGWAQRLRARVVAPSVDTATTRCPTSLIDYFIVSDRIKHLIDSVNVLNI